MSFPFAVFAGGWICIRRSLAKKAEAMKLCIAFAVELFVIYAIGVAWLSHSTGMTLYQAVLLGALPFLPIDACKAAIALPIALRIRQIHARLPIGITKNVERTD